MAERKAVNKYYPPDWDPTKGSINKHVGQHPLRDRAKKIKQGILVIRFEMPYNIWCGGCEAHIGMGVRYNAEKSRNGSYYTTPIYKFRMKCHLCDNYFEIQTDPQNHDYVILNGARRKEQRWDPKENGQIQTEDKATQKKMATDAMYKLEHGSDDVDKGKKAVMNLYQLEDRMDQFKEDYLLNRLARNKFRLEKKIIKEKKACDQALLDKSSLDIELVEEDEDDKRIAGLMKYSVVESFDEKQKEKRRAICNQPIFSKTSTSSANKLLNLTKPHPFSDDSNRTSPSINLGIRRKSGSDIKSTITTDSTSIFVKPSQIQKEQENVTICDKKTEICLKSECCDINIKTDNSKVSCVNNVSGLSVLMTSYSDSDNQSDCDM